MYIYELILRVQHLSTSNIFNLKSKDEGIQRRDFFFTSVNCHRHKDNFNKMYLLSIFHLYKVPRPYMDTLRKNVFFSPPCTRGRTPKMHDY